VKKLLAIFAIVVAGSFVSCSNASPEQQRAYYSAVLENAQQARANCSVGSSIMRLYWNLNACGNAFEEFGLIGADSLQALRKGLKIGAIAYQMNQLLDAEQSQQAEIVREMRQVVDSWPKIGFDLKADMRQVVKIAQIAYQMDSVPPSVPSVGDYLAAFKRAQNSPYSPFEKEFSQNIMSVLENLPDTVPIGAGVKSI